MKIRDIIERVDDCKPNAFSQKTKLYWIAELDGILAVDVFLMDIVEARRLEYPYPQGLECIPLVDFPYDEVYAAWLEAKIDYANGEYDKYQNSMENYNALLGDFVRFFTRTYDPAQGYRRGVRR